MLNAAQSVPGFVGRFVAHDGAPVEPHDALAAWHADPLIILTILAAGWCYQRGWHPRGDGSGRAMAFCGALVVVTIALLSPVDAISAVLLTGHMTQHVLLTSIAAPLFAWSAPSAAIQRGAPLVVRRALLRVRRGAGIDVRVISTLRSPLARWLVFVASMWIWHAAVLYEAAITNSFVHVLEHAMFLFAAWWFWSAIVGPVRQRAEPGVAILAVFTLTLQGAVLSMLMTFSTFAWYEPYAEPAVGWGIDPLTDQQLAGVVMWLPTGLINAAILIALLATWLSAEQRRDTIGRLA